VHERDSDRVMFGVTEQMRKKTLEVGNERSRRSLQLDVVVLAGAHFSACMSRCIGEEAVAGACWARARASHGELHVATSSTRKSEQSIIILPRPATLQWPMKPPKTTWLRVSSQRASRYALSLHPIHPRSLV
jgi:hypothetical protein